MSEKTTYSEDELVLYLKQRQQSAFDYLYEHYAGALYQMVVSMIPDKETAKDVLQEVFIKIWNQVETYDPSKGRLFTWMLNISRNASIDKLRNKNYKNQQKNLALPEDVYKVGGNTIINTDQIGLRKLVHTLKDEWKQPLELTYFQGYTQEEISKILDLPVGTVKTRLRAALKELRKLMITEK
ncbi:MAG: sigma-70 family RNA polymerase sigma factor [Bacteroidetes bacterium]|nr:sigma-70 family RNA polymerase sigma factor [Bacteroidota bacterium]